MNKKVIFIPLLLLLIIPSILVVPDFYSEVKTIYLESKSISILNFGDVMFDRGVRNIIENRDRDPFEYVKKDLEIMNSISSYDVVIANLEGPIVEMERSLCQQKAYNFQFPPDTTERLKSIGINTVTIANNHSYDCYKKGFESTKEYLTKAGIDYIGDSVLERSFSIKEINGKKVVFVGIDETVQVIPVSNFYNLVKKLKEENDYVVVNIHWGTEYELKESMIQKTIAHRLIENGADVIFGHHPHVLQPVEIYKGKAIFYSLGNFVFDQNFGDTTTGLGVGVEFSKEKTTFTLYPYKLKLFAPEFLKDEARDKFCESYLMDLNHENCKFKL